MVEKRTCNFCGGDIEPGTGLMFIKKDGASFNFCSNKCKVNHLELGRSPRLMKWTKNFVSGKVEAAAEGAKAIKKAEKAKKAEKEKEPEANEEQIAEAPEKKKEADEKPASEPTEKPKKVPKTKKE